MNRELCFIVPAYNEESSIQEISKSLQRIYPTSTVLVIDDGSSDSTAEFARNSGAIVISLINNLGIGGAVQTGLKYALRNNYKIAVQFDADGQHLADEVKKIITPIYEGKADYVIGSRWLLDHGYSGKFSRKTGIWILSKAISIKLNQKITDPTSGFRAMNNRTIKILANDYSKDYPEIDALISVNKNFMKILEVPVKMVDRIFGVSSIRKLTSIYYMVMKLLTIILTKKDDSK
jgi:glycosyltransferase involved in cell wall biosynthesis